jgi:hypothetical protein
LPLSPEAHLPFRARGGNNLSYRKNKRLLKNSVKREGSVQSRDRSIIIQRETPVIRARDFSPNRHFAGWLALMRHRGDLRAVPLLKSTAAPTARRNILLLAGRLRRFFNAWAADAIAQQAASAVRHQRDHPATPGPSP